jgi:hypothetical protein
VGDLEKYMNFINGLEFLADVDFLPDMLLVGLSLMDVVLRDHLRLMILFAFRRRIRRQEWQKIHNIE